MKKKKRERKICYSWCVTTSNVGVAIGCNCAPATEIFRVALAHFAVPAAHRAGAIDVGAAFLEHVHATHLRFAGRTRLQRLARGGVGARHVVARKRRRELQRRLQAGVVLAPIDVAVARAGRRAVARMIGLVALTATSVPTGCDRRARDVGAVEIDDAQVAHVGERSGGAVHDWRADSTRAVFAALARTARRVLYARLRRLIFAVRHTGRAAAREAAATLAEAVVHDAPALAHWRRRRAPAGVHGRARDVGTAGNRHVGVTHGRLRHGVDRGERIARLFTRRRRARQQMRRAERHRRHRFAESGVVAALRRVIALRVAVLAVLEALARRVAARTPAFDVERAHERRRSSRVARRQAARLIGTRAAHARRVTVLAVVLARRRTADALRRRRRARRFPAVLLRTIVVDETIAASVFRSARAGRVTQRTELARRRAARAILFVDVAQLRHVVPRRRQRIGWTRARTHTLDRTARRNRSRRLQRHLITAGDALGRSRTMTGRVRHEALTSVAIQTRHTIRTSQIRARIRRSINQTNL